MRFSEGLKPQLPQWQGLLNDVMFSDVLVGGSKHPEPRRVVLQLLLLVLLPPWLKPCFPAISKALVDLLRVVFQLSQDDALEPLARYAQVLSTILT